MIKGWSTCEDGPHRMDLHASDPGHLTCHNDQWINGSYPTLKKSLPLSKCSALKPRRLGRSFPPHPVFAHISKHTSAGMPFEYAENDTFERYKSKNECPTILLHDRNPTQVQGQLLLLLLLLLGLSSFQSFLFNLIRL